MKWAARSLTLFATVALAGAQRRPNVLMIMADDLDVALGSEIALPQTQRSIDRFVNYLQREARRLEKEDLF